VIAAAVAAAALVAGCGGGGGETVTHRPPKADTRAGAGPTRASGDPAADYARAERAMRTADYDTAIKLMTGIGGYRDARRRVAQFRVAAARGILAQAKRKIGHAPKAAMALTTTSLKYHPTPQARRFLRRAQVAHDRFKRRQAQGLESR
jgi:hypothetical protein